MSKGAVTAYPLVWPAGWTRMKEGDRTRARFHGTAWQHSSQPGGSSWRTKTEMTVAAATSRVISELRRFGVLEGDAIISTNLQLRLDGLPRSDQKAPADPGVAVYWQRPGEPMTCMAIDRYDRVADNLAAIAATLDAMRAIERHGGAEILERAFTGFTALPAPGAEKGRSWRDVLELPADEYPVLDVSMVDKQFRKLAAVHHPDREGGDTEKFQELNNARAQAHAALAS